MAAYVKNNPVPVSELPAFIASFAASLNGLVNGSAAPAEEPQMPARSDQEVRDAGPHRLAWDGQRFKSLKRHLMNSYAMTPDEHRAKWSLPSDYPMVAPNYSNARSALAKSLGLGGRKPAEKPKGRGRRKAA
jgi:predicted transcriptional regulator